MSSLPHTLHWLFPSGAAVAEWLAAIATGCLVGAGFIQLRAIRNNNDELKRQADEQRERWKREEFFQRLRWLDSRFNSPAMLVARSELGKEMTKANPDLSTILGRPKRHAWMVIYFFAQIAQMWKKELLELNDVDVAYGDYIDILLVVFGKFLEDGKCEDRFTSLKDLSFAMVGTGLVRELKPSLSGLSAAHIEHVRKEFWEREAAL